MSAIELGSCLAVLALAGFAHGVFGIGFAMIATPLLALFLDYRIAVLMAAAPLLVMAVAWLVAHRKTWWSSSVPMSILPGIAVGAAAGTGLQVALPQRMSLLLLAALLTFSVALPSLLTRWHASHDQHVRKRAPWFGAAAGVTESALNVGAPFMVLYGALARLSHLEQLLVLNLCFALGKLIQIALMARGSVEGLDTGAVLAGIGVSLIAYWQGDRLAGRFSEAGFRTVLRGFLIVMVVALMARVVLSPG